MLTVTKLLLRLKNFVSRSMNTKETAEQLVERLQIQTKIDGLWVFVDPRTIKLYCGTEFTKLKGKR